MAGFSAIPTEENYYQNILYNFILRLRQHFVHRKNLFKNKHFLYLAQTKHSFPHLTFQKYFSAGFHVFELLEELDDELTDVYLVHLTTGTVRQGGKFALLLKIVHCSHKGDMSELLSSLFKKEQCEWLARANSSTNSYFSHVFDNFPPFYAQERIAPVALRSFAIF